MGSAAVASEGKKEYEERKRMKEKERERKKEKKKKAVVVCVFRGVLLYCIFGWLVGCILWICVLEICAL